mgnify:CR=1 FL=1
MYSKLSDTNIGKIAPPNVIIRIAGVDDVPALVGVSVQTLWEAFGPPLNLATNVEAYVSSAFTTERLGDELLDPAATFLLAETPEGQLVGYAKLRRHRPPRQLRGQHAVEIQRLYVLNERTGTGLGRLLMDRCCLLARQEGFEAIWLGVWERNARGIRFYEKMGFQRVGWHYFQFGSERQRDYWMSKSIRE